MGVNSEFLWLIFRDFLMQVERNGSILLLVEAEAEFIGMI